MSKKPDNQKIVESNQAIAPQVDRITAFKRLTSDIGGTYGLFIEALWNSYERGEAKHIWVTIEGRGQNYRVVILDDGVGISQAMRQRFWSLAVTDEKRRGRNYQDLGTKRFAADFQKCRVDTISAEEVDGPAWTMTVDYDEYWQILAGNLNKDITAEAKLRNPALLGLPVEATSGTRIELTGSRDSRPRPTAETLRANLADHLPPKIANMVYVNGEPLQRRLIVGEEFKMSLQDPALGTVQLCLYVPKTLSARDQLRIGASDAFCSWRDFRHQVPDYLDSDALAILDDGVFGEIFVEGFERSVTALRGAFDVGLFGSDMLEQFIKFIEREVAGPISNMLGIIKKTKVSQQDEQRLATLYRYVEAIGEGKGGKVSPKQPRLPLTLNPSDLEVVVGSKGSVKIQVVRRHNDYGLAWDVSVCGGRTEIKKDGLEVEYWHGDKVGRYILTCYYPDFPNVKAHVNISIVSRRILQVKPARVTVVVGQEYPLEATNFEEDSSGPDNLRWQIPADDTEGRFVTRSSGSELAKEVGYGPKVVYRAGSVPGTYRIELIDNRNRRKSAHCDVTVKFTTDEDDDSSSGTAKKRGSGAVVEVEGILYKLSFQPQPQFPGIVRVIAAGQKRELMINQAHVAMRHSDGLRGDAGVIEMVLHKILSTHVDATAEQRGEILTSAERNRRFDDLYASVVEKMDKEQH